MDVLFSFRVSFIQDGSVCRFAAIPNWGFDAATSDVNHFAPQEILSEDGGWFERKEIQQRRGRAPVDTGKGRIVTRGSIVAGKRAGVEFVMSVLVGTDGMPLDARLEKNYFATERDVEQSLEAIKASRFIPGFYKDRPMVMRYYEILYANPGK